MDTVNADWSFTPEMCQTCVSVFYLLMSVLWGLIHFFKVLTLYVYFPHIVLGVSNIALPLAVCKHFMLYYLIRLNHRGVRRRYHLYRYSCRAFWQAVAGKTAVPGPLQGW